MHSAALPNPGLGIVNQMKWEQAAAKKLGLNWDVRFYCPIGTIEKSEISIFSKRKNLMGSFLLRKAFVWIQFRIDYYRWLFEISTEYDIFILRYLGYDPFQYFFVKHIKKPVYFVHHTLEVPEFASDSGFPAYVKAKAEEFIGKRILPLSAGIVGVTQEIVDYEMQRSGLVGFKNFVYPNGICYVDNINLDQRLDIPELIFVASFFDEWHGLDLIISAMKKNNAKFILHLVGCVGQRDLIMAKEDIRIHIHGRLPHTEILQLMQRCAIGLSSFALFRKGMSEASTLKVREYLMMGLPVYSGHKDIFPDLFLYYKNGPVDIDMIIAFAMQCISLNRAIVAASAREYIEKDILLSKFSSFVLG
nr:MULTISPECIES: glycosyltransferase [unclassified Polaromonas]